MQPNPQFQPRRLSYDEYLCWQINIQLPGGQTFVTFSVLEGAISADEIQRAWQALCLRHPMLGARVEEARNAPRFVPLDAFPPVQIRLSASEDLIKESIRLSRDADLRPGAALYQPFAVLNPNLERHVFLLVVNHAGSDGSANITLHSQLIDLLNTSPVPETQVKTLPPSAQDLLLGQKHMARFFVSGAVDMTRQLRCSMLPHEVIAPFTARQTSVMLAIADAASTQSIVERASKEYGLTSFFNARLLKVQFDRMRAQKLCDSRARLPLYLPVDLRSSLEASMKNTVYNATFGYSTEVTIEDDLDIRVLAQRVHTRVRQIRGKSIAQKVRNWYSPTLVRHAIARRLNATNHFGSYTTHMGRFPSTTTARVRRTFYNGFGLAHSCFLDFWGFTIIDHDQLILEMGYCEPVVKRSTAEHTFRKFLELIGIDPAAALAQDYDDVLSRLCGR